MKIFFARSYFYIQKKDDAGCLEKVLRSAIGRLRVDGYSLHAMICVYKENKGRSYRYGLDAGCIGKIIDVLFYEFNKRGGYEVDYNDLIERVMIEIYDEVDCCIGFCMNKFDDEEIVEHKRKWWRRVFIPVPRRFSIYATGNDHEIIKKLLKLEDVSYANWSRSEGDGFFICLD